MGSLCMLNESGDTTIAWTADRDDEVEAIIEKKMAAGCSFFIVDRSTGLRQKLTDPADAMKHRTLAIPDEDWRTFAGEHAEDGTVVALPRSQAPVKTVRKAKTAKEVATNDTVGVKQKRGG